MAKCVKSSESLDQYDESLLHWIYTIMRAFPSCNACWGFSLGCGERLAQGAAKDL